MNDYRLSKKRIERIRRNKEIAAKLLSVLAVISVLVIIINLKGIIVKASDDSNKERLYKYYTSVCIDSDDTLWSLEEEYNNGPENKATYIKNLKELNNMSSDSIYSGRNLLVYYYSTELK